MLDVAIKHQEQLKALMMNTWFKEEYMFYNCNCYFEPEIVADSTWVRHQFVSLNDDGNIVGYISYHVCRQINGAYSLGIIHLTEKDDMVFARDVHQAITDVFEKFHFNKLEWDVVIGNPVEHTYDSFCKRYGGRIIGIKRQADKLFDNKLYDRKLYELLAVDYFKHKQEKESKCALKENVCFLTTCLCHTCESYPCKLTKSHVCRMCLSGSSGTKDCCNYIKGKKLNYWKKEN